jgi:hypothetical protein
MKLNNAAWTEIGGLISSGLEPG